MDEMANARESAPLNETGDPPVAESREHAGNDGGVDITAYASNENAKPVDVTTEPRLASAGADSDDASSEGSMGSEKTIKGDNEKCSLYSPLRRSFFGQGNHQNLSGSSPATAQARASGNDFVGPDQTNSSTSVRYTSLHESANPQVSDYQNEMPSPTDHRHQRSAFDTQSKVNGTQINGGSPIGSSAQSKSVRIRGSPTHTPSKDIDASQIPLPMTPNGHGYDISAPVISPASTPRRLASFLPSLRHRRSLSLKLIPSPLGPGHAHDDLGSDISGLVASPTTSNNMSNDAHVKTPSTTTTEAGYIRRQIPLPSTPTNQTGRKHTQNGSPPLPNGRSTGVSNLPFIPASPSIMLQGQPSHHQRFPSINGVVDRSLQNNALGNFVATPQPPRGLSHGMSVPRNPNGRGTRVSLPPASPVSGAHFSAPPSMAHGLSFGAHPAIQLNNLYTAEDNDPFIDKQPTFAHTLQAGLPSPFPIHPNTRSNREVVRDEWIRTQAARITTLSRNLQTLQQKYNNDPAGFTHADVEAYNASRVQLEKALSLDAQVESRRGLFMPEGVKPLRTQCEEDAFRGMVLGVGGRNHTSPSHNAGENSNENGGSMHSKSHLLGFRMALMERRGQAVVSNNDAETREWNRTLDGLDNEGKKAMRKRAVASIRGATERRMEKLERNMRDL